MLDRTFKFVYVTYKDGSPKPSEAFTLVTDIQYYNDYIVIEYYKTPDKVSSAIIMTRTIGGIGIISKVYGIIFVVSNEMVD